VGIYGLLTVLISHAFSPDSRARTRVSRPVPAARWAQDRLKGSAGTTNIAITKKKSGTAERRPDRSRRLLSPVPGMPPEQVKRRGILGL